MPELPEVETIVRGLQGGLIGQSIREVIVPRPEMVGDASAFVSQLRGRSIQEVQRRGKFILLRLEGLSFLVHLGMTGRLLLDPEGGSIDRHTHLILLLEGGGQLCYHDPRRFGRLHLIETQQEGSLLCLQRLGPEPLEPDFTPQVLAQRVAASGRAIKELLLDQHQIAGIGNIYASEILHQARLHPLWRARALRPAQVRKLHRAIQEVLSRAIAHRGTTISDYLDASGDRGGFQALLQVYGREGDPCHRCRARIQRIVQGQRSTFFCPRCQAAPDPASSAPLRS
ncbi:MAG: bifunctional DNA-formamidopyrimidine glycosylase/DNA-(apurinic or apyrimidinic site) lyase [Candidatus Tectomicrobia bacterium]|uniref:Formamidopyrimidine-DNA glycosylase n=1 Tax=Tectimicrobiota bacterium TaxID=2528274 RepID=A0A932CQ21_UNCTE|nr:bifunctional DNA-formamidopyrimidine glycosylase/DNA-(apurinic or apyrimidinic site) lyase [Candidatus Tectomicrobia bacterium]